MSVEKLLISEVLQAGPVATMRLVVDRLGKINDPAIFISRRSDVELLAAAESAEAGPELPLRGVPFVVKDNIDVGGLATTAGCPAWRFFPSQSAPVVQLLEEAGAICIGKTNLDQFATGLVGTRTPYGIPRNPYSTPEKQWIPGGSSCGSAVSVATGIAAFGLGTDTAGSGRVPAAFNNLFGWKPTRGLLSTRGVVPACRTLDCVTVFTNTAADVQTVLPFVAKFDAEDAFAREGRMAPVPDFKRLRVGVPDADSLQFFADKGYADLWEKALARIQIKGAMIQAVDFSGFLETARLLYEGPWVAERYRVIQELLEKTPEEILPVTRGIIEKGANFSAAETFGAFEKLAALKRKTETVWNAVDVICTPTAPTIYTVDEVEAEPVRLNSNLGYYTNFMNLLDLSAVAAPAGFREDGAPFGVTFFSQAFHDLQLLAVAGSFCDEPQNNTLSAVGRMEIAVCGAHMRGLPLNPQLVELGGRFMHEAATAPCYRFYAIDERRPGLVRSDSGGSIQLEIWSLPSERVGDFLAQIPSPLGLGRIELSDGKNVCGFLCESAGVRGKREITELGSWRKFFTEYD